MQTSKVRRNTYVIVLVITLLIALAALWRTEQLQQQAALPEPKPSPSKVELLEVSRQSLTEWTFAEGTTHAARREYLQLEASGIVTQLGTHDGQQLREGSVVAGPQAGNPGTLLMRIDTRSQSAELKAVMARVAETRSALKQAEREYQRASDIRRRGVISQSDFDAKLAARDTARATHQAALAERERTEVVLDKAVLRAPFDGLVTRVNVREGDFYAGATAATSDDARESAAAFVIMDTGQYEATLNLPQWEESSVKIGQTVYIARSDAALASAAQNNFTDGRFSRGKIVSISPSISLDKRASTVKVLTDDGEHYLRDGAYVTAWIATKQRSNVLAIPETALVDYQSGGYVFVYEPKTSTVRRQSLTLGAEGLGMMEVTAGLNEGDRIVVRGLANLTQGTPVVPVNAESDND